MSIRIGIVGISGFGGGEAMRLVANHPAFELVYAAGEGSAGKTVGRAGPRQAAAGCALHLVGIKFGSKQNMKHAVTTSNNQALAVGRRTPALALFELVGVQLGCRSGTGRVLCLLT